jgi:xanthine dehydrogenase accessory factor
MNILSETVKAVEQHGKAVLATIVASSGSTPLPSGSSMLIPGRGAGVLGTIGGGLLEATVIKEGRALLESPGESFIKEFELNEPGSGEGMICGGSVAVLMEKIGAADTEVFSRLAVLQDQGSDCVLLRWLSASGVIGRVAVEGGGESAVTALLAEFGIAQTVFQQRLQRGLREERVERVTAGKGELIIQPVTGAQPLLICGGGHVGRSVSRLAASSGFTVTIADDRKEYATRVRFPEAVRTIAKPWAAVFSEVAVRPSSFIVIVTHGHQSDKEVLRLALGTPARYIGMIGSGKKVVATFDGLRNEGVSEEALKRVHAPIGLDIGAVTADEIAVSIVAELIRERRRFLGVSIPLSEKMKAWFDRSQ